VTGERVLVRIVLRVSAKSVLHPLRSSRVSFLVQLRALRAPVRRDRGDRALTRNSIFSLFLFLFDNSC